MQPLEPPLFQLVDVATRFGLTLRGDPEISIRGVNTLSSAVEYEISFLANSLYRTLLTETRAGAVVLTEQDSKLFSGNCLISHNPYLDFARIAGLFEQRPTPHSGIHPSAIVMQDVVIDASASIGPLCVIQSGARIEAGAEIGPGCTIGSQCVVGASSRLVARVTLVERVKLGQRVLIHPGAVIGAEGFGLVMDQGQWIKVPQLGGVRIGDDCEVGANTSIDRGTLGDTILENDVHLDNQIQIAHNVFIGAHTVMAGCVAVAGSARIGKYCQIGGGVGIVGHIEITDHVTVGAMSRVTHHLREPGEYCSGTPIQNKREWRKNAARFRHLDEIVRIIKPGKKHNED